MFQFPGVRLVTLWIHVTIPHQGVEFAPFGYPRIKACSRLPVAFRQRATSFIASWCQGIHRMPFSRSLPQPRLTTCLPPCTETILKVISDQHPTTRNISARQITKRQRREHIRTGDAFSLRTTGSNPQSLGSKATRWHAHNTPLNTLPRSREDPSRRTESTSGQTCATAARQKTHQNLIYSYKDHAHRRALQQHRHAGSQNNHSKERSSV